MPRYGLIGMPLGHSASKEHFDRLFARLGLEDCHYSLYELASLDDFGAWFRREGLSGCNVTSPYKQRVIAHLDRLDVSAAAVNAVNCICIEDGSLVGYNTDAPAFQQTLERLMEVQGTVYTQAYILGSGGAAHAVGYALQKLSITHRYVSRTPAQHTGTIGYDSLRSALSVTDKSSRVLIVNATPVGMPSTISQSPLPSDFPFGEHITLYDLIYNPSPTLLMRCAAAKDAKVKDGLEMLHLQADLSWQHWSACQAIKKS